MFVGLRDKVIWVLADMNDEDESSTLLTWLAKSVAASLVSGQLHVVLRAEAWSGWHACFAKNTSHMAGIHIAGEVLGSLSAAENVILVNCDSDNLPSLRFFAYLLEHHADMCTPVQRDAQNSEWPRLTGISFRHPGATSTTGRICLSALVFLGLGGYDQAMLPMGFQDIDLTKRLVKVGNALNVHGAEETGNVLNNVMEWVRKRDRRKQEIKAKVANVAPEHKVTPWEYMNDYNRKLSMDLLAQGVLQRNKGLSLGLTFQQVVFKDLLGGVSPSHHHAGVSPPPKASGSASSSSAAAPTAAASTAAAPTAAEAQKPKFKPPPPPGYSPKASPRAPPGPSREPLKVRFFTFGLRRLAQVYKKSASAKQFRLAVIDAAEAPVPGGHEAVAGS